jgi:hypothetical protein
MRLIDDMYPPIRLMPKRPALELPSAARTATVHDALPIRALGD